MPTIRRKIDLEVNAILRKARIAEGQGVKEFLKVVDELRERVILIIAEREKLSAYTITEIKNTIASITETYRIRFEDVLSENQRKMFVKGIQTIDVAIDTANILKAVPYLSEEVLSNAQKYGAELVTGLTDYVKAEINKKLMLGLIGQKSSTEIINEIAGKLPSPSVFGTVRNRAMIIARTESNRILSLSTSERMKQVGEKVPDLNKTWQHSHLGHPPRLNHLAMDGIKIPYNEKFKLLGNDGILYEIDGPYDSILPAGESINCRCHIIPSIARFDKYASEIKAERLAAMQTT